jgi:adenylate cyclase
VTTPDGPNWSEQDVAVRAGVSVELLRGLRDRGIVDDWDERAVGRARLIDAWIRAGPSLDTIAELVGSGRLALGFLDTPSMATPGKLELTFEELCRDRDLPFSTVADLHMALGFEPPQPDDHVGEDDEVLLDLLARFEGIGAPREAGLRVFGVYADALRRLVKAEAEFYETNIESRLRRAGRSERELKEIGGEFGSRITELRERAITMIYQRHREHVWIEHSIGHAEAALAATGLPSEVSHAPTIASSISPTTRGSPRNRADEVAADVAGRLAALVKETSRRHDGRPIRWLGDGGMYFFRDPRAAVEAGLDMVAETPRAGLPPAHIGIHTGPVIEQDGDGYGRTVNLASRIASFADGGMVVVSGTTVEAIADRHVPDASDPSIRFEPLGAVAFKGVPRDVPLLRATVDPVRLG